MYRARRLLTRPQIEVRAVRPSLRAASSLAVGADFDLSAEATNTE